MPITPGQIARLDAEIALAETKGGRPTNPDVARYDFGKPEPRRPGYVIPTFESLGDLSRVQLRARIKASGLFPSTVASVLTRREMKLLLTEVYPFEVGANYGVESREIKSPADVIRLCGDRRAVHNEKQAREWHVRTRGKLEAIGEAGLVLDPREIIERRLAGKTFGLVQPEPIILQDRVGERFYDIDGRAGRGSYYLFRALTDSTDFLKISPPLWFGVVRPDQSLIEHFIGYEHIVPPRGRAPGGTGSQKKPQAERRGESRLYFADFEVGT